MGRLTLDQLNRKIARWSRRYPEATKRALENAAEDISKRARTQHLSGPRMPVGQTSETNPTINSGGSLRGSITHKVEIRGGKVSAQVRSRHGLAQIHHEGAVLTARGRPFVFPLPGREGFVTADRVRIPARPFLRAPLQAEHKQTLKKILREIIAEYRKR